MKEYLLNFLLRPFVIALPIALFVIWLMPDFFSKYELDIEKTDFYKSTDKLFLKDLNGDGISERILFRKNTEDKASFLVHYPNDLVQGQYNFNGYFHHGYQALGFADLDADGFQEIYLTTHRQDSIFLNIAEPFDTTFKSRSVYIDSIPLFESSIDLIARNEIGSTEYFVQETQNGKRVVFGLMAGFLQYPRTVYSYDLKSNKVRKSAHLTNPSFISDVQDIDDDGSDELVISNYSADNNLREDFTTRSDGSSWLTVLDDDLNFLFEPIEHPYPFSALVNFGTGHQGQKKILSLFRSQNPEDPSSALRHFSLSGKLLNEKPLSTYTSPIYFDRSGKRLLCYIHKSGKLSTYDTNDLEISSEKFLQPNLTLKHLDLDANGDREWVGLEYESNRMLVYNATFSDSLLLNLPHVRDNGAIYIGTFLNNKGQPRLYYQNRDKLLTIKYAQNPLYVFKWSIYLGVYLAVILFVWAIMKLQSLQESKKRRIEAQIAEFQMKTIKNQLDPHFVFNAMNTISEMNLSDNKLEADKYITSFSSLMRKTLKGSDKIAHSLQDELDYINTYIELQCLRLQNRFDYDIAVEPGLDTSVLVPKHVLYTYVENAIKHGLAQQQKGALKVSAKKQGRGIQLSVSDNGEGLGRSRVNQSKSTGNGLKIMERLFQLYQERYKKKITLDFSDNGTDTPTGLTAIVTIT